MYSWKQIRSGVTLVELLLSIAILGILGSVVILAINPTRQIGQANDAADTVNMSNVRSALNQYFAESTGYPTAITTSLQMICAEGYIDASCI
jgi:prepilin-type N-terminal cleavage/methylation domain-containing protein